MFKQNITTSTILCCKLNYWTFRYFLIVIKRSNDNNNDIFSFLSFFFLFFCFIDTWIRVVFTGDKIPITRRLNFNGYLYECLGVNMVEHTITEGLTTQKRISLRSPFKRRKSIKKGSEILRLQGYEFITRKCLFPLFNYKS